MTQTYPFRREDNGEIVELDFEHMIEMDVTGCVTLPDGVQARRVRDGSGTIRAEVDMGTDRPIVSDSLGCIGQQVETFREDAQKHGFSDVEFRPDPLVAGFYQAHCSSPAQWQRYVAHRGKSDFNSRNGSGAGLSPELLERAKARILEA